MPYRSFYGTNRNAIESVSATHAVNGGLNEIGTPALILDDQWSEQYGWHVNKDGTISQRSMEWVEVDTVADVKCSFLTTADAKIKPFYFDSDFDGTKYLHVPGEEHWSVKPSNGAQVDYDWGGAGTGRKPKRFTNAVVYRQDPYDMIFVAYNETDEENTLGAKLSGFPKEGDQAGPETLIPPIWNGGVPDFLFVHQERIYAVTGSTLTWSRAYDPTEWYGTVVNGYVAEDAGVREYDSETQLYAVISFAGALYIFGDRNVYKFTGSDASSFHDETVLAGVSVTGFGRVASNSSAIYYYSEGVVWEYNGGADVHPISYGSTVRGGIAEDIEFPEGASGSYVDITADDSKVVVHVYRDEEYAADESLEYEFNLVTRTWEKHGATAHRNIIGTSGQIYPMARRNFDTGNDEVDEVLLSSVGRADNGYLGHVYGKTELQGKLWPSLVSKAYSLGPATKSVLANLWLQFSLSDTTTDTDITVSLSKVTEGDDDWVVIWHAENYRGSGGVETKRIIVPVKETIASEHYRIKIDCRGALMTLYPYTREVRALARR